MLDDLFPEKPVSRRYPQFEFDMGIKPHTKQGQNKNNLKKSLIYLTNIILTFECNECIM